ncbi:MAG: CRISPR-associated protein Cas4 [Candidatus Thermoplasmatota archaeon]
MISHTDVKVTGTQINYYFICTTKLWLFSHHIQMEKESDEVSMGKHIHETSYERTKKNIIIDDVIAVDFIKKHDGIEIHDVKKSRKMEVAHRWQLLYYLYYLKQRGVSAIGVLDYPLLKKKEILHLGDSEERELEKLIQEILALVSSQMPSPMKRPLCKKCSYYEFCFGGE